MKYIRTKDGIIDLSKVTIGKNGWKSIEEYIAFKQEEQKKPIKQADTIEELCDYIVYNEYSENGYGKLVFARVIPKEVKNQLKFVMLNGGGYIKLSILKDDDLICVAKINPEGETELL